MRLRSRGLEPLSRPPGISCEKLHVWWTSQSESLEFLGLRKKHRCFETPRKHAKPQTHGHGCSHFRNSCPYCTDCIHRYSFGVFLRIYSWVNQRRVNQLRDNATCPADVQGRLMAFASDHKKGGPIFARFCPTVFYKVDIIYGSDPNLWVLSPLMHCWCPRNQIA